MANDFPSERPPFIASPTRYDIMSYRRMGRSGLDLPAISLGLWQNFGEDRPLATQRAIIRRAFDLGITHFDLANVYGNPHGSAEENFGRILKSDLHAYRDELVISTKAGAGMSAGPYGDFGSRKSMLTNLEHSLKRLGCDYVDIFYSHRPDPRTPLEETMAALDLAVRQGKVRYVGVSSYSAKRTKDAAALLQVMGTPLAVHLANYSMLNRWVETEVHDALGELGVGSIAFSPLAQGLLTDRYLSGMPADSRAANGGPFSNTMLNEDNMAKVKGLSEIAKRRGQSLAQMAIAWTLRDQRVTSSLIGASSVAQLEANHQALNRIDFEDSELTEIDRYATDGGVNLWREANLA